jgi:hypothetical protein
MCMYIDPFVYKHCVLFLSRVAVYAAATVRCIVDKRIAQDGSFRFDLLAERYFILDHLNVLFLFLEFSPVQNWDFA